MCSGTGMVLVLAWLSVKSAGVFRRSGLPAMGLLIGAPSAFAALRAAAADEQKHRAV
jgi:hypothetical protein